MPKTQKNKTKYHPNTKSKTNTIPHEKVIEISVLILLGILIFTLPFFKGLFFRKEILKTYIASFTLFMAYGFLKVMKKEKIEINSSFGFVGVSLIIVYALPVIFGQWADLGNAVDMILRHATLFMVYLMVKDFSKEEKYKKMILNILIGSGIVTALIGILGATGYVHLPDVIMGNRIASTFQYPNTLAAFMMTLFFITLGMKSETENAWQRAMYAASGFIMLFTFIFTYSRAAWLLFPLFALLYLIIVPAKAKLSTIFYYMAVSVPIILVLQPFTRYVAIDEDKKAKALLTVVIATVLFSILYMALEWIGKKISQKQEKIIYALIGGIAVVGVGVGFIAFQATGPLVFDNMKVTENKTNLIQRVVQGIAPNQAYALTVDVKATSNEEEGQWPWKIRVFGVDEKGQQALLIDRIGEQGEEGLIDIPFTTGEEIGKLNIYFTNYHPKTKVEFKEVILYDGNNQKVSDIKLSYKYIPEALISRLNAIDTTTSSASERLIYYKDAVKMFKARPIIGAGGGAWKGLYTMYQSEPYNSTEAHNYFLQTLVETGLLGVLLLFSIIALTVWVGFQSIRKKETLQVSIVVGILSLLGHSLLDFNFSYLSIPIILWVLIGILDKGFQKEDKLLSPLEFRFPSVVAILVAIPFLWLSTSNYLGMIDAEKARQAKGQNDLQAESKHLTKAVEKDPFQTTYRVDLANALKTLGAETGEHSYTTEGNVQLKKALKQSPYNYQVIQQVASYQIYIGNIDEGLGHVEDSIKKAPFRQDAYDVKAKAYMAVADHYQDNGQEEKAMAMREQVMGVLDDIRRVNDKAEQKMALAEGTMDLVQRTKYYLDNKDDEEALAKLDGVVYLNYVGMIFATGVYKNNWLKWNSGENSKINYELTEAGIEIWNKGETRGLVYTPNFTLEPSTDYELVVNLVGQDMSKNMGVIVTSSKGTESQLWEYIGLNDNEERTLILPFTTTADIEPQSQRIMFENPGGTEGSFIVKEIILRIVK